MNFLYEGSLQHRVFCKMSSEEACGVFVQQSQCSHDYRMIFESPFTFMWSLLLNDGLFCCFVLYDVVSVI